MADIQALEALMAQLLAEDGCPWDRAQDHQTLRTYLLEETYEVLEAIDLKDYRLLQEELGDLLYQIVFHAHLAQEAGAFGLEDVIQGIVDKMVRRHPHVFGDAPLDPSDPEASWEVLKQEENPQRTNPLASLPPCLPSLMKAEKFLHKIRKAGYQAPFVDLFPQAPGPIRKILEIVDEEGTGNLEVDLSSRLAQGMETYLAGEPQSLLHED